MKHLSPEAEHVSWFRDLGHDARHAGRTFLRTPGITVLSVLTLALGISLSTALFSVIDAAVLRPLPYSHPEQLVDLTIAGASPSVADLRAWRQSGVLSHVGMGRVGELATLDAGTPRPANVAEVTEDFIDAYGVRPVVGRAITLNDTLSGAPAVGVLGFAFWQTQLGADPHVLGRIVNIDSTPTTIIGVLPQGFYRETDVWRAFRITADSPLNRRGSGTPVMGRVRPGLSHAQVASVLTGISQTIQNARASGQEGVEVVSLSQEVTEGYISTVALLACAVGILLAIACVNVAGLQLAEGVVRRPELALRTMLGASRGRLARQLLTESLMQASVGAGVGVALAWWSLDTLVSIVPLSLPATSTATMNFVVLGFTVGLTVATALGTGLFPAWQLTQGNLGLDLAIASRRHGSRLLPLGRNLLVAVEVALAVVLVAGAGLMIRSLSRLLAQGVGYDAEHVVTMDVEPVDLTPAVSAEYYPALLIAVRHDPDVAAAGTIDSLTLRGGARVRAIKTRSGVTLQIWEHEMLPGYFQTLRVQPIAGQLPLQMPRTTGESVAVLNASAVRRFFSSGSPLGEIVHETVDSRDNPIRIVAIVPDINQHGPGTRVLPEIYVVPRPTDMAGMGLVMRPRPGHAVPFRELRDLAATLGPRVVISEVESAADRLNARANVTTPKHRAELLALLGALSLSLTLLGVFCTTSYGMAQRTQEIGVRLALGGPPRGVVARMMLDAAAPIGLGLGLGLLVALLAARSIASFLFNTPPSDPATFVAVALAIGFTATIAAWIPARKAAQVDPVATLRNE